MSAHTTETLLAALNIIQTAIREYSKGPDQSRSTASLVGFIEGLTEWVLENPGKRPIDPFNK